MHPLIREVASSHTPESLAEQLPGETGLALLRSSLFESAQARYSLVAARPFLTFRSFGSRCELLSAGQTQTQFGNPWHVLDGLMARYELLDELDMPFPLGGCFGYWGYDLKNFVEPRLPRRAVDDLELPDCVVGFHASLVIFDHRIEKTWIVSTGVQLDGSRDTGAAQRELQFWEERLARPVPEEQRVTSHFHRRDRQATSPDPSAGGEAALLVTANCSRPEFVRRVLHAQRYIRAGDIYQVNLAQRLSVPSATTGSSSMARNSAFNRSGGDVGLSTTPWKHAFCGALRSMMPSAEKARIGMC